MRLDIRRTANEHRRIGPKLMRIAALPMYDLPEIATATDAWWRGLAGAFRSEGLEGVPNRLDRRRSRRRIWGSPDLLFAQTCGYPMTHEFAARFTMVATPSYAAPGCEGTRYRSLIVVREDHKALTFAGLRDGVAAVNTPDSHSGFNILRWLAAREGGPGPFFRAVRITGSHRASLAAVRSGNADTAAIDCVTHALLARHAPFELSGTRVIAETPSASGLPYVTSAGASPDEVAALRRGLVRALADPHLAIARDALLLAGAVPLEPGDYQDILTFAREGAGALDLGRSG